MAHLKALGGWGCRDNRETVCERSGGGDGLQQAGQNPTRGLPSELPGHGSNKSHPPKKSLLNARLLGRRCHLGCTTTWRSSCSTAQSRYQPTMPCSRCRRFPHGAPHFCKLSALETDAITTSGCCAAPPDPAALSWQLVIARPHRTSAISETSPLLHLLSSPLPEHAYRLDGSVHLPLAVLRDPAAPAQAATAYPDYRCRCRHDLAFRSCDSIYATRPLPFTDTIS